MDLSSFEQVPREEFDRALEQCFASPAFRNAFARTRPNYYEGWEGPDCQIHLGDLKTSGRFEAPGFHTLITGSLHVDGMVDLHNPLSRCSPSRRRTICSRVTSASTSLPANRC